MTMGDPGDGKAYNTRLEDAEAMRLLWDDAVAMARDARRLAEAAARLTHTLRRFCELHVQDQPNDPRYLLAEYGAVLELCLAIDGTRIGMEEAASFLGFSFVPKADPHPLIEPRAREELRVRVAPRRRVRPRS